MYVLFKLFIFLILFLKFRCVCILSTELHSYLLESCTYKVLAGEMYVQGGVEYDKVPIRHQATNNIIKVKVEKNS